MVMEFDSKAAQKKELFNLNNKFSNLMNKLGSKILDARMIYEQNSEIFDIYTELYWNRPNYLYQWNKKKANAFIQFDSYVISANKLRAEYDKVKTAKINNSSKKFITGQDVKNDIYDILKKRKLDYVEGLVLSDKFGGLDVYVNAHMVFCDDRKPYVRHFFYLFGKLTALNTIIAVAEEHNRKNK